MGDSIVKQYVSKIPGEVRAAIEALDNPIRLAILEILSEHEELAFTQLRRNLEIQQGKLGYHLGKLKTAALIDSFVRRTQERNGYSSFYRVSELAEAVLDALYESLVYSPKAPRLSKEGFREAHWEGHALVRNWGVHSELRPGLLLLPDGSASPIQVRVVTGQSGGGLAWSAGSMRLVSQAGDIMARFN